MTKFKTIKKWNDILNVTKEDKSGNRKHKEGNNVFTPAMKQLCESVVRLEMCSNSTLRIINSDDFNGYHIEQWMCEDD